jgi:putative RecB family exonuclease
MAFKRSPKTISVQGSRQLLLPEHISFSSRETLTRCARSWMLKYLAKAPQRPALWLAGGSAVHEVTEKYDRMALVGQEAAFNLGSVWERLFDAQLAKLRAKDPNEWNWKRSQSEPIEVWNQMGPEFVQSYIDWRQRSPYEIWTTPDGVPAIELDVSGRLPGCPVEIKAYLDRVFHDPVFDQLIIVDLKTSKRPPKSADQFGVYAALLEAKYGVRAKLGAPFMNRRASLGTPFELEEYTADFVGAMFGEAWEQITAGEFPATGIKTNDCYLCDTSSSCYAKGGPLSAIHDPADPSYPAPF